jgi:hypothetical protein
VKGSVVLPRSATGVGGLAEYADQLGAPEYFRRDDVVYVTSVRDIARAYAAMYPNGGLYEVMPVGDVGPDPDHMVTGVSFMAPSAVVVAVVDPLVWVRSRSRDAWLRLLNKLP